MSSVRSIQRNQEREADKPSEISISLGVLERSAPAIAALVSQELPARQAFQLGKLLKVVQVELDTFNDTRKKLIADHGGKWDAEAFNEQTNAKGKFIFDPPENQKKLDEGPYKELIETEVSLMVPRVKLSNLDGVKLTGAQMMLLDWLIED